MRRAIIFAFIMLMPSFPLFAQNFPCGIIHQELACDLNNNGVADVADMVRMFYFVGGNDMLDSLPKYGGDGDCDCDNLHFTVNDLQALAWRMIDGYSGWKQGTQLYSDIDIISIPQTDASPGDEIDIPVYVDTERELLGLQFYVRYDFNLLSITDFTFSESLPNAEYLVYKFEGGISVYALIPDDLEFDGFVGYLNVSIDPDTPVGTELELNFGNDPHKALYTGLGDASYYDESRIIGLNFIHPAKDDGIINVVEGRLIEGDENTFSNLFASPNPFNGSINLTFQIERQSSVRIDIFDMLGRRFSTLLDESLSPGDHSVIWNADQLPSGVYFCRLAVGDHSLTKRITLLK